MSRRTAPALFLLGAVLAQQLDKRCRETNDASACARLGLGRDAVHVAALRA